MLVGFSLNHPFGGTPIYGNPHVPNVFAPGVLNTLNRMSVAFRHDHLDMGCSVKLRGKIGKIKPPFSYGFPMVFLWSSYDFPGGFGLKSGTFQVKQTKSIVLPGVAKVSSYAGFAPKVKSQVGILDEILVLQLGIPS